MSKQTFEAGVATATETNMEPIAYVSMSPSPDLELVYLKVIKPTLESRGLVCKRNENKSGNGIIVNQALEYIDEADLVLCDLTHSHATTYYELGIAHAFRKTTVLISQETGDIPFDTRYQRALAYKDDRFSLLEFRDAFSSILKTLYPNGAQVARGQPTLEDAPVTLSELEEARMGLFHHSGDAKRYAVRFLGDNRDKASYEKICFLINSGSESHQWVRDALTALYKINPEKALEQALLGRQGIWHASHLVRERVVSLIGNYAKTDSLIERLIPQLTDSSWGVRVAVCQVLGKWGAESVKSILQQRRVDDPEQAVRLAAEEALFEITRVERESTGR